MAADNNGKIKTVNEVLHEDDVEQIADRMYKTFMNEVISRSSLGSRLGTQFNGERDLYATFGYKRSLEYADYRGMYDRLGIATRLVEKFSNDTWNAPVVLLDGSSRSDNIGDSTTEFLDKWNELTKRLKLWGAMREADTMCGMGKYSIILLGTGGNLESPASKDGLLNYVAAYDESQATIDSYIKDEKNPKYGMPEYYMVEVVDYQTSIGGNTTTRKQKVHHSRVIHVSENRLGSRVFGRPRLQEVYNRLMDYEKVTGGGAEAAWLAVYMGFLILTREGVELPAEGTEEWNRTEEAIQLFAHRIQRFATLKGVEEVVNLGVHEVRIRDIYSVICSDLAGSKGIPQRILFGSERGELASTQDMHEWNGVINSRRTNFAEPEMLDPFIQWCIEYGVLPAPQSPDYLKEWQPVYAMTELQEADYAFKVAQGANMLTSGGGTSAVKVNEFRGMIHLPPTEEPEPVVPTGDVGTPDATVDEVVDSAPTPKVQPETVPAAKGTG